jgi:S-DNA-T family DNA segregation ATPase FtsK/SpoIIIE
MRSTRSVSMPMPSEDEDGMSRLVRKHLGHLVGLALIAGTAAIATALATWTVDDPSLSYAVTKPAANMLGLPGAIIADLLMQFFGLAVAVLLLPAVVWGWRCLFGGRPFRKTMLLSWLGASAFAAALLALVPVTAKWPLPTGMGGVIGDIFARIPALIVGTPVSTNASFVAGAIFAAVALVLFLHATGFMRAGAECPPAGRRAGGFRRQGRDHRMSAPARSSRSTNSSRRPASSRRASSACPTTSPAR